MYMPIYFTIIILPSSKIKGIIALLIIDKLMMVIKLYFFHFLLNGIKHDNSIIGK